MGDVDRVLKVGAMAGVITVPAIAMFVLGVLAVIGVIPAPSYL
jgi:hypothetical protein